MFKHFLFSGKMLPVVGIVLQMKQNCEHFKTVCQCSMPSNVDGNNDAYET